jgi:hypothetical protein
MLAIFRLAALWAGKRSACPDVFSPMHMLSFPVHPWRGADRIVRLTQIIYTRGRHRVESRISWLHTGVGLDDNNQWRDGHDGGSDDDREQPVGNAGSRAMKASGL